MITKFPVDAPKRKVIKTLKILGFQMVKEKEQVGKFLFKPPISRTLLIKGKVSPKNPSKTQHL